MPTIVENGIEEEPKASESQKKMSLKSKGIEIAKNIKCCSS